MHPSGRPAGHPNAPRAGLQTEVFETASTAMVDRNVEVHNLLIFVSMCLTLSDSSTKSSNRDSPKFPKFRQNGRWHEKCNNGDALTN